MGRRKKSVNYHNKHGITWAKVDLIRQNWASGDYTAKQLRKKFGVNCESIIRNKSWKCPHYKRPKFIGGRRKRRDGFHKQG
jgi:hypothetical protein